MRKILSSLLVAAALLAPASLEAQRDRRDIDRREERGHRVAGVISDLERRTTDFRQSLRRALDRSPLEGTRREDELNRDAARLDHAVDRLKVSWNEHRNFDRSRQHLGDAIAAGRDINRTVSRHRLRGHIQREWDIVRSELNRLAEVFDQPKIRW